VEEARRATEAWEATVAAAVREEEARVALSRSERGGSPLLLLLCDTELQLIMHCVVVPDLLRLVRCNRRLRTVGLLPFSWKYTQMSWPLRVVEEEATVASSVRALMALSERMRNSVCVAAGVNLHLKHEAEGAASSSGVQWVLDAVKHADVRVLRWVGNIFNEDWTALLASPLLRIVVRMILTPSSECDMSRLHFLSVRSPSLHTLDLHLCNFSSSERRCCLQLLAALPALTDFRWSESGAYRGESQVAHIVQCAKLERLKLTGVFLSVRRS